MKRIVCFFIIGLVLGTNIVMANETEKKKSAIASAEQWLNIVDDR